MPIVPAVISSSQLGNLCYFSQEDWIKTQRLNQLHDALCECCRTADLWARSTCNPKSWTAAKRSKPLKRIRESRTGWVFMRNGKLVGTEEVSPIYWGYSLYLFSSFLFICSIFYHIPPVSTLPIHSSTSELIYSDFLPCNDEVPK